MKIDQGRQRVNLNTEEARSWGLRFCGERNARKLSIQDVADQLLLSKHHVVGLETADLSNFYSTKLFAQAADKYAVFLDFDDKPSKALLASEPECNAVAFHDTPVPAVVALAEPEAAAPILKNRPSGARRPILLAAVAVSVFAVGFMVLPGLTPMLVQKPDSLDRVPVSTPVALSNEPAPTPTLAAPTQDSATASAVAPAASATAASSTPAHMDRQKPEPAAKPEATSGIARGHIELKFTGSSWVQSVDTQGVKQEKIYRSGDTLALEANKLQALIVGNAGVVSISNAQGEISLKPYIGQNSQVARILGPDARKLGN